LNLGSHRIGVDDDLGEQREMTRRELAAETENKTSRLASSKL
jgi:hypothetical protein